MGLALFDFDGTISNKDSFLLFMWWADRRRLARTMVWRLPQIVRFKLKYEPNQRLKEGFLTDMFAGHHSDSLRESAEKFCAQKLPSIVRPGFWACCERHKDQGDRLVVVTATPRLILEPWCRKNGMEIIGSELEIDRYGKVTGRLIGNNCMGEEKVARIRKQYDLSAYSTVYAYGDTAGDLPMLGLALPQNRFYKPFRQAAPGR